MAVYDLHKNFSTSLIAVAPVPAASGTTFSVTPGEGALFPAVAFNAVVWPAGASPTAANAEIVRVTNKGTGDNWTVTRVTESSNARSIAVGDQISAAITAKMITDIETAQAADATAITLASTSRVPGGRLTLTTALPFTTADVLAAGTLYYTPYLHNVISLYSGTAWADYTFPELSIAVPAVANQMYDVFVFDNAGVRTLELLAWTNDTTRATALVRQDGHWCKTGALTRLYVGSFRTTGTVSQTEDSVLKRYVWNMYNRVPRTLLVTDATATWAGSGTIFRQVRGQAANQVEVVVGLAEVRVHLHAELMANNTSSANIGFTTSIGFDSTTTTATGTAVMGNFLPVANGSVFVPLAATLEHYPTVGRHFYAWLERQADAVPANTLFFGAFATTGAQSAMTGWIDG